MIRKSLLLFAWFPLTIIFILINFTVLTTYASILRTAHPLSAIPSADTSLQLTAAGGTSQVLSATIQAGDARVLLVESFLTKQHSPMSLYAENIVAEADRFGLDFRMLPSIAMCESNAGKHMPKKDEYNAFGIAVYTGRLQGKAFTSWPHAIEWVSKYIKERYVDRGYSDLRTMGAIWAPPSVETGYSWSNCVQSFMNAII